MRLPHYLLESQFFSFKAADDLKRSLGDAVPAAEREEIDRLISLGLPPATSRLTLGVMLGVNPGLLWSFENRTERHYRSFSIPKGKQVRKIDAPKVGLKLVQKWMATQLERTYVPPSHVFGFVRGRSHVQAAQQHLHARWVLSLDIADFFPSTSSGLISNTLQEIGYSQATASSLTKLFCLRGALAQGAPSSPILSNLAFRELDNRLSQLASFHGARLSRYADDIVFSGVSELPVDLMSQVTTLFDSQPWRLSQHKTHIAVSPQRLKVHGLLVHGAIVRLTKGYRNRLRAYKHLIARGLILDSDVARIAGHLSYEASVDQATLGRSQAATDLY